ncbi:Profilin [Oesophagostomum dentatum]|uniref:Profilin n=1 Tax=Oesophagostomum dentatum TaxID=61180 RepID=A0A0B1T5U7_OESDE|nr:Profilin [Oesophagostomum dentatum]
MSGWQAYITSMTESSPAIKRAAIIGTDGSVWARTQNANAFRATEAELKKFVALFDNLANVPSTGADLEEVHYIVPRTEENLIFGKKEKSGFFAAKTKTGNICFSDPNRHVRGRESSVGRGADGGREDGQISGGQRLLRG